MLDEECRLMITMLVTEWFMEILKDPINVGKIHVTK